MLLRRCIKITIMKEVRVSLLVFVILCQVCALTILRFHSNIKVYCFHFFLDVKTPVQVDVTETGNRTMHVDSDLIRTKKRGRKDNI